MHHPDIAKRWSKEYPQSDKGLPYHVAANEAVKSYKENKNGK